MNLKNILLIITLSIFIISCGENRNGKPINLYGNSGRDNDYSDFGDLSKKTVSHIEYKASDISGASSIPISFNDNRIAVQTIKGSLIMLNSNGVDWEYKLPENQRVVSGMCADPKHNIYMLTEDGNIISVDQQGNQRWQKNFSKLIKNECSYPIYSDLLATDKGIYAAVSCGTLAMYDFSGNLIWQYHTELSLPKTFCADENSNIYITVSHNSFNMTDTLVALDRNGKIKWQKSFQGTRLVRIPVFSNGKLYISGLYNTADNRYSRIYCINPEDATEIWSYEMNVLPMYLSADSEKNIYIAGFNSGIGESISALYKVDSLGKLIWKNHIKSKVEAPMIVGDELLGVVSFKREGAGLHFFSREDGQLKYDFPLNNYPIFLLKPTVTTNPEIVFAGATRLELIKISESKYSKIFE